MTEPDAKRIALAAKLQELGRRFAERNIGDLASLDACTQRLRAGASAEAALSDIESIAHRINGTAATLGFPEVSDAAETLERRAQNGAAPDCIVEALEALRASVSRGRQKT